MGFNDRMQDEFQLELIEHVLFCGAQSYPLKSLWVIAFMDLQK